MLPKANGQLPVVCEGVAAPMITSGGAQSSFRFMLQYRTNRAKCEPSFVKRVDSVRDMLRQHNPGWAEGMVLNEIEEYIASCSNGNSQICDHTGTASKTQNFYHATLCVQKGRSCKQSGSW